MLSFGMLFDKNFDSVRLCMLKSIWQRNVKSSGSFFGFAEHSHTMHFYYQSSNDTRMWILEDVCELGWSSIDDIMLLSMFV
jgi:hypothetical protein